MKSANAGGVRVERRVRADTKPIEHSCPCTGNSNAVENHKKDKKSWCAKPEEPIEGLISKILIKANNPINRIGHGRLRRVGLDFFETFGNLRSLNQGKALPCHG